MVEYGESRPPPFNLPIKRWEETEVIMGAASVEVVDPSPIRVYLRIQNVSDTRVTLELEGNVAVIDSGITIYPLGSEVFSQARGNNHTGFIYGVSTAAGKNMIVVEGFR